MNLPFKKELSICSLQCLSKDFIFRIIVTCFILLYFYMNLILLIIIIYIDI